MGWPNTSSTTGNDYLNMNWLTPNAGNGPASVDNLSWLTNPSIPPTTAPAALAPPSLWDGAFQQKRMDGSTSGGYLQAGLGLAQGLGSLYMGMQQYKLAKDSLAFQKDSWNKDYGARVKDYNSQIEDRQRARVASNAGAYQSVGDYMAQNRMG